MLGLNVFGAFRVQQVVVGDPLQVEVLVAQVVLATEKRAQNALSYITIRM